ncbi:acid phosphatase [Malassezia vespertilionis]|nr:acid phosphatase [Malassezia vespertilionis]WFD05160.1 acid phosphatase [Malassezia vespertilionis]
MQHATPPIPLQWNFCHTSHSFDRAVLRKMDFVLKKPQVVPSHANIQRRVEYLVEGEPRMGDIGSCLLGELTDQGRLNMLRIGHNIRSLYVGKLHLLPAQLHVTDADRVYFRTTDMTRTTQSLEQVVTGFFGSSMGQPGSLIPSINVRNNVDEDMLPNSRPCAKLALMMRRFSKEAATIYNPQLAELDNAICPHNDGVPPRVDGQPKLSGLIDTARAAMAHKVPIPHPFSQPVVVDLMEKAVVHEWFAGYETADLNERRQYRRLAMGAFSGSLYDKFARRVVLGDKDPLRLSLYLGHDATLIGLLHVMDCFNGKWPAFAASLSMELFRNMIEATPPEPDGAPLSKVEGKGFYVRCRYGDETLFLPACAPADKHFADKSEFCTLDAFRQAMVDNMQPADGSSIAQECAVAL